ncbi:hypothetical protein LVB87_07020 [Lysobacter sp. KIS68-7]|uniref:hypothetical protein n=1 Tax=Lysobacter sp. KIS68-7 TaxID=2904252 RepID=UPI001E3BB67E|nr:hypothetical protein [Lysobacter sp. KIS68-7]UHQ20879.1 hypothetical protein LVB87_07020 [Lysobacter sp. KIS68-7]
MRTLACALLGALTFVPAFAAEPVQVPLDAAHLAPLPRHPVEMKIHERALHCEGVALVDLLRAANAMPTTPLRGAHLARVAVVTARDGYRVVFSLGELDASLGGRAVYLVDRCDGKAIDDKEGPLRLLVPDDTRPARAARQVQSIHVEDVP